MRHPLRALALGLALAATPACASLQLGETRIENPLAAARSIDQRAYALLHAYAASPPLCGRGAIMTPQPAPTSPRSSAPPTRSPSPPTA